MNSKDRQMKKDGWGWTYVRKKKTKASEPGLWSEQKKLETVTTLIATGSPSITSAMTGVPVPTINNWVKKPWYKEMVDQIREAEDMELSAKLKKVVDKSLETVIDRIENGDFQYDPKTGKMIRVPVKMRDTHKVMSDVIDKKRLLQKQPSRITEHQASVDDRLANLANQFAAFVSGNTVVEKEIPVNNVVEGDDFFREVVEPQQLEDKEIK